jgi:hypothetical protein
MPESPSRDLLNAHGSDCDSRNGDPGTSRGFAEMRSREKSPRWDEESLDCPRNPPGQSALCLAMTDQGVKPKCPGPGILVAVSDRTRLPWPHFAGLATKQTEEQNSQRPCFFKTCLAEWATTRLDVPLGNKSPVCSGITYPANMTLGNPAAHSRKEFLSRDLRATRSTHLRTTRCPGPDNSHPAVPRFLSCRPHLAVRFRFARPTW